MQKAAIIIPTYKAQDQIYVLIESVKNQNLRLPVYVINSISGDDNTWIKIIKNVTTTTIEYSKYNHGGTRQMVVNQNPGFEFYIFLTQDSVLPKHDAVSNILKPFYDRKVGAVCGRQVPHPDANLLARHARIFNYPDKSSVKSLQDNSELGLKAAFLSNSFAAYRANALKDAGGFPDHVIFGEDMYVAAKMLLKGWKIAYAPDAECRHSHNYTLVEEFKRYFDNGVFHAREPWIREMLGGTGGEGFRYVMSELRFLGWKYLYLWPSSIFRNGLKLIAFRLGLLEKYIPKKTKKNLLSMNRVYWNIL